MNFNRVISVFFTVATLSAVALSGCLPGPDESETNGGDTSEEGMGGAGGMENGCVPVEPQSAEKFWGLQDPNPTNLPGAKADILKGHKESQCLGYNIHGNSKWFGDMDGNCHNAARRGEFDGVVICRGNPTMSNPNYVDMSQYHTFQYKYVEWLEDYDGPATVFYNWSEPYTVRSVPADKSEGPDMQDGTVDNQGHSFLAAGQLFCGVGEDGQWSDTETRSVPGNGGIEDPTPNICQEWVKMHRPNSCNAEQQCIQCCNDRATFWTNEKLGLTTGPDFNTKCVASCVAAF